VADVDALPLPPSSGPEYWRGWSVRNEKELELTKDEESEKDARSVRSMEPPAVDWFDGSSTPWMRPSKLRTWQTPVVPSSFAAPALSSKILKTGPDSCSPQHPGGVAQRRRDG
jgi:hypothetical protein